MSVGRGIVKADIDNRAASIIEQVHGALDQANAFALLLANTNIVPNDTFLTNLGYTAGEVTLLRAAINDLGNSTTGLWAVAHNLKTVTSTNNFFFNAQQLTGVNWAG